MIRNNTFVVFMIFFTRGKESMKLNFLCSVVSYDYGTFCSFLPISFALFWYGPSMYIVISTSRS
jgi:hypothetical protein